MSGRRSNLFFSLLQTLRSRQLCAAIGSRLHGVVLCASTHSSGAPRHRTFPPLNLHRARVRRNHGRLRSYGFIERAQSTLPNLNSSWKRASDKALTFCFIRVLPHSPLPGSDRFQTAFLRKRSKGLSRVRGNSQARFLEGWTGAISSGHSILSGCGRPADG